MFVFVGTVWVVVLSERKDAGEVGVRMVLVKFVVVDCRMLLLLTFTMAGISYRYWLRRWFVFYVPELVLVLVLTRPTHGVGWSMR